MKANTPKGIAELLSTSRGHKFLMSENIHTHPDSFQKALAPPADSCLTQTLGAAKSALVYMHQQIYLDYRPSVLEKIFLLDSLGDFNAGNGTAVQPVFVWIDTDRAASDKPACRFYWPFRGKARALKITSPSHKYLETRFARVEPLRTAMAFHHLADYVRHSLKPSGPPLARLEKLRESIVVNAPVALADYGLNLTQALFHLHLRIERPSVVLSDLLARGFLDNALETILEILPEFIAEYNDRITALRNFGIATSVGYLPPDYLPFFYSVPENGKRLRMHHAQVGKDHFATAVETSGRVHRFFLGTKRLCAQELTATGRWSPDVTLPILINDLFSGWIAGKSSALYALVFQDVLRKVLGKRPIPILVPTRLADPLPSTLPCLLHDYVTGESAWYPAGQAQTPCMNGGL